VTGVAAKIGLSAISGPVGAFFGSVPKWCWIALAGAVALAGGLLWHHSAAVRHDDAVRAQQKAADESAFAKQAAAVARQAASIRKQTEQLLSAISQVERNRNAQANRATVAAADDLRLRGPGKASCGPLDYSGVPASPGGHDATIGKTNAPVAAVPDPQRVELIALPFAGTVNAAEVCDMNRNENATWRDWYAREYAAWEKMHTQ
jgi:multidrug efflux pump subunit AcrA (membrane-fusion protein)